MLALAVIFGAGVGFALGLTGGGGSILAVPMLVYGLTVPTREAVGVSLASVGATSLVGAVQRLRRGEVELRVGLLFALAGVFGTPVGAWVGHKLPDAALLLSFAALMVWVAVRMWRKAVKNPAEADVVRAEFDALPQETAGPACRRDPAGRLRMTSRCSVVMALTGVAAGVLAGLFGVGGGFVIVPALVLFSGMDIRRAVATSLLVIALVSASGVATYLLQGQSLEPALTLLFAGGGVGGLFLGSLVGRRLEPAKLQQVFAVVILAVAAFVIVKNVV